MSFDHRGVIANAYASCLTQLFSGPTCPSGSLPGLTSCVENTLATANPEQAVLDGLSAVCTQCSELRGGGSPDDCVHALVHNGLTSGADPQAIVNLWGVTGADAAAMRSCLAAAPMSGSCGMATNRCIYPTTAAPASTCRDN